MFSAFAKLVKTAPHGLVFVVVFLCARSESAALEMRGIMISADQIEFNIDLKDGQTPFWVPLGKSAYGVNVLGYEAASRTLTVTYLGTEETLRLPEAVIGAMELPAIISDQRAAQIAAALNPRIAPTLMVAAGGEDQKVAPSEIDQVRLANLRRTLELKRLQKLDSGNGGASNLAEAEEIARRKALNPRM